MKVYAASRRDLAYAIQSYNDNDSITFISTAKVQIKNVSCKYFGNYYTNQKARPLNNKMANADTLDGAGVNSGNALDAAKVQKNFETAKDLAKKNCLLSYHSALIAGASVKAAHGAALLSELSSTEEPGCSELLRPAVCSFRTIASVLRRMESRFTAHYCRGAQTYRSTRNFLFRTLQ